MTGMGKRLEGKAAFITGAASGIGRQSALRFAAEGALVAVVDVDADGASTVANEVVEAGGKAIALRADVSSEDEVAAAVAAAEEAVGHLDGVFNNAGIMHRDDGAAEATEETVWDLTMDINLKGVWFGCRHGIPALRRSGGGSIINTASFVALVGAATPQLAYTASKGAVLAMTRELSVIHARENIRVNLFRIALAGLLLVFGMPLVRLVRDYASDWVMTRLLVDLQWGLGQKLLRLPLSRHRGEASGELLTRLTSDTGIANQAQSLLFGSAIENVAVVIVAIVAAVYINWRLALITLLVGPPIAAILQIFGRKIRRASQRRHCRWGTGCLASECRCLASASHLASHAQ